MKKLAIVLAVVLALSAIGMTALAADTNLGAMTAENDATQKGWCSNGTDGKTTDLTYAQVKAAKYLVVKTTNAFAGGLQFIWQGNANEWAWDQTEGVLTNEGAAGLGATLSADGKTIVIELSKMVNWSKVASGADDAQIKFFLGYYSENIASLGTVTATLSTSNPLAGGSNGSGAAATGESPVMFIALGVLLMAGVGAVVFARKAKKN